jgi:antimicrobial peptide system SdpA family protein
MKNYNSITIVIASLFTFFVLLSFNSDNTFNINTQTLGQISPQGYAFFTKNPKEPQVFIYKVNENNKLTNICPNSSSVKMFFGLSRRNTRLSYDFTEILSKLNNWEPIDKIDKFYITKIDTFILSSNDITNHKGKYLIVKEDRIPWAWSKNLISPKKSFKFITIK